jgi:hypothetical protein
MSDMRFKKNDIPCDEQHGEQSWLPWLVYVLYTHGMNIA